MAAIVYIFEGISQDLPRPPMAALRALLSGASGGIVVSARAWQELPLETRQGLVTAGSDDVLNQPWITDLVRRIPVSQVKLVGKRTEPEAGSIPADLAAALGPVRPLSNAEWASLRPLDRHVLASLVKNTRLFGKAINEILPPKAGGPLPNAWAGAVARTELRVKKDTIQRVVSADFVDGRAFVLANVAGRRAARRASEVLDQQADATVGPVEIDWGLRPADDVLFWQAHVSDWDGTFFPAAALLATTTAAAAMYDMVKTIDPHASVIFSGVREEPWQAGRDEQMDAPTALYRNSPAKTLDSTIRDDPPPRPREGSPILAYSNPPSSPRQQIPPAMSSSPALNLGGRISAPPGSNPTLGRSSSPASAPAARPKWHGPAIIGAIIFANLLVIFAMVAFLTRSKH